MTYKRKKINPNPQTINDHNWFYDGEKKLTFVHEVYGKNGQFLQTDSFSVSIKKLSDFINEMQ